MIQKPQRLEHLFSQNYYAFLYTHVNLEVIKIYFIFARPNQLK